MKFENTLLKKYILILDTFIFLLFDCTFLNSTIKNILFVIILILTSLLFIIDKKILKKPDFHNPIQILIIIFFIIRLTSFIYHGFNSDILHQILYELLFICLLLFTTIQTKQINYIYKYLIFFVFLFNIIGLVMALLMPNLNKSDYYYLFMNNEFIWKGVFSNPNICGIINSFTLIILFKQRKSIKHSFFFYLISFISLLAVILSGSRNALLILIITFFYCMFHHKIPKFNCKMLILILIIPILCISYFSFVKLSDNIEIKLNTISATRYDLWQFSFKSLKPLEYVFGQTDIGIRRYDIIDQSRIKTMGNYYATTMKNENPHNGYIKLIIEDGVFCFYILLFLILYIFLKYPKNDKTILIFILGINLFESLFISGRSIIIFIFWISLTNQITDEGD